MFDYLFQNSLVLPKLGWVAALDTIENRLSVIHGRAVEVHEHWCVEGVWDGQFNEGKFDLSENTFGSGIKVAHDKIIYVPSSATVDRIFYCEIGNRFIVANSLVILLTSIGGKLNDQNYKTEIDSIRKGIDKYERKLPIDHPEINYVCQVIHENLVFSKGGIRFEPKNSSNCSLNSFSEYEQHLRETLGRIHNNAISHERHKALTTYSTISRGYDSTAVSTLVKDLGVNTCFTCQRSNSTLPAWFDLAAASDDGTSIANILGQKTINLGSNVTDDETETLLLAGTALAPEMVFHDMCRHIEEHDESAVVFTGYHGDKVWDVATSGKYLTDQMVRGDISGIGLTEVRLKSGFINVPVPFIFAKDIASIVKISNLPEMDPWRLNNTYDRPIPRRIVESANVDREAFGVRKKAVLSNELFPMSQQLKKEYIDHLRKGKGWSRLYVRLLETLQESSYYAIRIAAYMRLRNAHTKSGKSIRLLSDLKPEARRFSWATNRACQQLAKRVNIGEQLNRSIEGKSRT